jgi:IMP dehydrogenase
MTIEKAYSFDDILLVPKFSDVKSRKDIDTSVCLGKGVTLKIPIISANMKSIATTRLAIKMLELGGMPILHRFDTIEERIEQFEYILNYCEAYGLDPNIGVSFGVTPEEYEAVKQFKNTKVKIVCIDVAHGHHTMVAGMINHIIKTLNEPLIIAGNVASSAGAIYLSAYGVDIVKVGIGNGSVCSTRIATGNGMPQFSALKEVEYTSHNSYKIISDGGIKNGGDIVKALCFADTVMIGRLFAQSFEASTGKSKTIYAGSSTHKTNFIEGVAVEVQPTMDLQTIVESLMEGVVSGMSYQGASSLKEFRQIEKRFVEVSNSGILESKPRYE